MNGGEKGEETNKLSNLLGPVTIGVEISAIIISPTDRECMLS